jgi:hypothetical protein
VRDEVVIEPSADELDEIVNRAGDPIIARVAAELRRRMVAGGDAAADAREAFHVLHGLDAASGEGTA